MNPKSIKMAQKLADCYEQIKDYISAQSTLADIIRLGKVPPDIYYQYAMVSMKTGDIDKAETIFKKVIQLEPDNALAHKDLGVVYLSHRLFDYAEEEFKKAYELAPQNPIISFEFANFYYAMKKHNDAESFYKKALELRPENTDFQTFAGLNYTALGRTDEALDLLTKSYEKNPKNDTVLYNLGLIYYQKGQFENAKQFLLDAYSIHQGVETINLLALTFFEVKEYENAAGIVSKLLHLMPDNINVLLLAAKISIEMLKIDKAQEYLEKILKIFPEQPEAKKLYKKIKGA